MKDSKLLEVFKDGNIVIPMYFFKNIKSLKLDINEFIFLMYLYNKGNKFLFDPNEYSSELNMELLEIMNLVSSLTDKGFLKVEVKKNAKGYMEELISLDDFYNKIVMITVNQSNKDDGDDNKKEIAVFEYIEREFGRTLGATELEIIKAWLENNMSEDLIKEAVKEAVSNGVFKLRYIDKILYEWGKKGINSVEAVEDSRKKKSINKENGTDNNIDLDALEWNWFDDENEED